MLTYRTVVAKIYEFDYSISYTIDYAHAGDVSFHAEDLNEAFRMLYGEIIKNEKKEGREVDESAIRWMDVTLMKIVE